MKSVALLTTALFFTVAPSPDAKVLSEITGGFLKEDKPLNIYAVKFNPIMQFSYVDSQPPL